MKTQDDVQVNLESRPAAHFHSRPIYMLASCHPSLTSKPAAQRKRTSVSLPQLWPSLPDHRGHSYTQLFSAAALAPPALPPSSQAQPSDPASASSPPSRPPSLPSPP